MNLFIYFLVGIILYLTARFYIPIAKRFQILDYPNHRSSHDEATIRGGGVLFYIAVLLFFLLSGFMFPLFFVGVSILAFISFLDDLKGLSSAQRLPFHFIGMALIFLELNFGLNHWAIYLLLLLIGVTCLNVYNFMDGIDGITFLYSLVTSVSILLFLLTLDYDLIQLWIFECLALLIFGYFNLRGNTRFFAGDIGSISIAAVLIFGIFKLIQITNNPIWVLLLSVYMVDGGMTILKRLKNKENITTAHRKHLYQQLVDVKGASHLKTAFFYALTQVVVNVIIFISWKFTIDIQWIVITLVSISLIATYIYFQYQIIKNSKSLLE